MTGQQGIEWLFTEDVSYLIGEFSGYKPEVKTGKTLSGIDWYSIEDSSKLFKILTAKILFKREDELGYYDKDGAFIKLNKEKPALSDFVEFGNEGLSFFSNSKVINEIEEGIAYSLLIWEDFNTPEDESDSTMFITGEQKDKFLKVLEGLKIEKLGKLEVATDAPSDNKMFLFEDNLSLKVFKEDRWQIVSGNIENLRQVAMTGDEVTGIPKRAWEELHGDTHLHVLMSDGLHMDSITQNYFSYDITPIIQSTKFYILNTKATIQVEFKDNILKGVLDDEDKSTVQYRIFLNEKKVFPEDTEWTSLANPQVNIEFRVNSQDIILNEENSIKIEFKDGWGETDAWSSKFIGDYKGLMFYSENGELYSDEIGNILQYLDFGNIIAGSTTEPTKIKLENRTETVFDSVTLGTRHSGAIPKGVSLELSTEDSPFVPSELLSYQNLQPKSMVDFFVRISTNLEVEETGDKEFNIYVSASESSGV